MRGSIPVFLGGPTVHPVNHTEKSMHVLKTPKIIAHPLVLAKVVTSTTGTGGFIAQPIRQGAAGTEV